MARKACALVNNRPVLGGNSSDITKTSIPEKRIIRAGDNGCVYWWIEWDGEHDIVDDNEMIRDELWAAVYGIWDYIKNSGKFDADTMALEWVGAIPANGNISVCLRIEPATAAYDVQKVRDGYARPYAGPHEWISGPLAAGPARIEARRPAPVTVAQVDLVFDDDVNEDLINLHHHHRTPFEIMPSLVRDYRVQAYLGGGWTDLVLVTHNRTRHHRHVLDEPVRTDRLRLVLEATNGDPYARVVSMRAYAEPTLL